MKKLTQEQFLKKVNENNQYFKSGQFEVVGEYVNSKSKILCKDKYGHYMVCPLSLFRGSKPSLQSSIDGEIDYTERFLQNIQDKKNIDYLVVGVNDQYKMYLKTSDDPIKDAKLYKNVLRFIFIRIWNYMFKDKWIFKAPLNFGQFYVAESFFNSNGKSKGYYKDWVASKKKGKIVYSYNFHTLGRKFYIKWNKLLCRIKNGSIYKFTPYRGESEEFSGKIGLAAWINKCSEDPYLSDFRGHII